MVHDALDHDFRRLRLDTHYAPNSVPDSYFASYPRNTRTNPARIEAQQGYSPYASHVSSELSSTDLLGTLDRDEEFEGAAYLKESGDFEEGNLANSKQSSQTGATQPAHRERGASISFSSHATLDDGARHSLGEPLPKIGPVRRRTRGASIMGDSQGDSALLESPLSGESPRISPFTGEPIRRRTRRSDMMTRLDRIESAQDSCASPANTPSFTSGSTSSPPNDAVSTPLSTSMINSMLLSPGAVSSPAVSPSLVSEPWPMSYRDPVKSRICSRQASLRNSSRRSSRLSGSSPATAFLSQWGKDSQASIAPDPDEEGQTIGINHEYVIGRQVGYGGFSVVKELHGIDDDGSKIRRTVKIVRKNIPDLTDAENEKQQQAIEHEVDIWRYLQNEYILPLHAVYDTEFATFCVMDLVEGGTLFELVRKSRTSNRKALSVSLTKHYAYQLACALRYLHQDIRLIHRDVKLENCLLDMSAPGAEAKGGQLRLCDFGLADFISGDIYDSIELLDLSESSEGLATDIVGTLQYACPEAFAPNRQALQPSVDMWAFGVCLYTMITGELPFKHSMQSKVIQQIISGNWNKQAVRTALSKHPDHEHIMDILDGCLEIDAGLRWTISDVVESAWFDGLQDKSGGDDWQMLS